MDYFVVGMKVRDKGRPNVGVGRIESCSKTDVEVDYPSCVQSHRYFPDCVREFNSFSDLEEVIDDSLADLKVGDVVGLKTDRTCTYLITAAGGIPARYLFGGMTRKDVGNTVEELRKLGYYKVSK